MLERSINTNTWFALWRRWKYNNARLEITRYRKDFGKVDSGFGEKSKEREERCVESKLLIGESAYRIKEERNIVFFSFATRGNNAFN